MEYAKALDKRITIKQQKEWAQGTPEEWANESHRAAVDHAYLGVLAEGNPPRLDAEYAQKNERVLEEQLEKAGVRLAVMLNAMGEKN